MTEGNQTGTGITLILLGLAIAGGAVWLYQRIATAEAQGLHFRFHWFFYAIYKIAGKTVTCSLLGAIGIAIAFLGLKKIVHR